MTADRGEVHTATMYVSYTIDAMIGCVIDGRRANLGRHPRPPAHAAPGDAFWKQFIHAYEYRERPLNGSVRASRGSVQSSFQGEVDLDGACRLLAE